MEGLLFSGFMASGHFQERALFYNKTYAYSMNILYTYILHMNILYSYILHMNILCS